MTKIVILALAALMIGIVQPTVGKAQSTGPNYAVAKANKVNPTTKTGGVQAGLGLQLTPKSSGVVRIIAQATGSNIIAGDGISIQVDYGTGAPPKNGVNALPAGATAVGQRQISTSSRNGEQDALAVTYIISGLTLGQKYWFDLIEASVVGGTAQLNRVVLTAVEFATFAIGARVATTTTVELVVPGGVERQLVVGTVRTQPSTTTKTVCTEAPGSLGTITAGPQNGKGFVSWYVAYDNGCTGWTVQSSLAVQ